MDTLSANSASVGGKKRKIFWILLIILLLLILAVLIFLYLTYFKKPPVIVSPNNIQPPQAQPTTQPPLFNNVTPEIFAEVQGLKNEPVVTETSTQNLLFIGNSFAERFGSFSNQSGYKNFDDLNVFMTDKVKQWIVTYKAQLSAQYPEANYFAIETKAISSQITMLDEQNNKGEILVKTQRQEFKNTPANPRVYYQDLLLKIVKINNEWKVDGAYWQ